MKSKTRQFIVTIEYQGEEEIYSGDIQLLMKQYKKTPHLEEIYGDIQKIDVEEYDSQGV